MHRPLVRVYTHLEVRYKTYSTEAWGNEHVNTLWWWYVHFSLIDKDYLFHRNLREWACEHIVMMVRAFFFDWQRLPKAPTSELCINSFQRPLFYSCLKVILFYSYFHDIHTLVDSFSTWLNRIIIYKLIN